MIESKQNKTKKKFKHARTCNTHKTKQFKQSQLDHACTPSAAPSSIMYTVLGLGCVGRASTGYLHEECMATDMRAFIKPIT